MTDLRTHSANSTEIAVTTATTPSRPTAAAIPNDCDGGDDDDDYQLSTKVVSSNEAAVLLVTSPLKNEENGLDASDAEAEAPSTSSSPFVVKASRANSKLILQNMEEVLNSVKKKHRQKHKRKKEQKKLAMMEAAAAAQDGKVESSHGDNIQKKKKEKSEKKHHHHHHHHKKPLQEKTAQENGVDHSSSSTKKTKQHKQRKNSPLKSAPVAPENASILKHFSRTPKKDDVVELEPLPTAKTVKSSTTTTNAFEIMMNARNKSIGSNTPGKEAPTPTTTPDVAAGAHVKRKLMLQEWADKKGAAKRKIDEDSRAAYVDKQLDNRAKRFKKMLVKDGSPKTSTSKSVEKHNENCCKGRKSKKPKTASNESAEKEAPKTRARTRRLSSPDSLKSVDEDVTSAVVNDTETAEFLAKLNSPTKKRDSLLGYFQKKDSPKDINAKITKLESQTSKEKYQEIAQNDLKSETKTTETLKRRLRRTTPTKTTTSKTFELDTALDETKTTATVDDAVAGNTNTPSGRPKRSCAGKNRYNYDLDKSPVKIVRTTKTKTMPTAASAPEHDSEVEVIDLDCCNATSPQQTPKKLAPLFVRSVPKPSPDPVLLKARQDFLRSGVPQKLLLEMAKQKQYEQSYEESLELFPKVAHVRQWSADEKVELQVKKNEIFKFKFRKIVDNNEEKEKRLPKSRGRLVSSLGFITACTEKDFCLAELKTKCAMSTLPMIENKRSIIKAWKSNFERFPTYKCYNQMREKYRYFSAVDSGQDTEQVTESFVVTRRTRRSVEAQRKFDPNAEEERPPATAPNGELLFSEKYKPLLFEQVLVNLTPVTQLREFLASWSNGSNAGSTRNSQQQLDDTMDFVNDSNSSQQGVCNSVVLLGPGSSGKTSAVFALANEMNFNVLEINAGMKRTGKKLIQELQEATQSHQIRKESTSGGGKTQKNLLKMSLNGLKSKKQLSQSNNFENDSSSSAELGQSAARKCLILIEDADIVFEQTDAGFTDAVYTLAASSKRPVIVVATNPNCHHLQRLMNQNTIRFLAPNVLNISKFLCVLSLIENCPINLDDLISLYLYNDKDLRRTIMELQFFVQSGGDRHRIATLDSKNKQNKEHNDETGQFFASPSKRRFSEETSVAAVECENSSEKLGSEASGVTKDDVYMHRTLFEFFTVEQNERVRIPFPADFRLLRINLNDIFQVSQKLKTEEPTSKSSATTVSTTSGTKRKTRSPKKAWLCSATKTTAKQSKSSSSSLSNLCDFYENASVAALLGAYDEQFSDRLVPHLAEHIAHNLVEQAIVVNLAADTCPYNLFDTPVERHSLCDYMGPTTTTSRSKNARSLDYEPNLRAICRSEKLRSTLERRSTRFYHYLRNTASNILNFNTDHFDSACDILKDERTDSAAIDEVTIQT